MPANNRQDESKIKLWQLVLPLGSVLCSFLVVVWNRSKDEADFKNQIKANTERIERIEREQREQKADQQLFNQRVIDKQDQTNEKLNTTIGLLEGMQKK